MVPSGYQNNGRALPGTVGQTNDGWLLLEYQAGLKSHLIRQTIKKEKIFTIVLMFTKALFMQIVS